MNIPQSTPTHRKAEEEPSDAPAALQAKVAAGLALLTFLVYLPVVSFEFICYDDVSFVTNNPKVAAGLTWEGVKWAFTSADIDYWRPLSWLSHMLDIEVFGAVAGGHHLTSMLIHVAGSVMALIALHRLTGRLWPSAVVAALFAWHPLHVESVAWIAERKDVLCGFAFFFSIWAYARYVENPCPKHYLTMLGGFFFGVMSKPMIVTLPCVLLLLDYWPLNRIRFSRATFGSLNERRLFLKTAGRLAAEKLPMLMVVLALGISTIHSQHKVGTLVAAGEVLPIAARFQNAITAYGVYLGQAFWPSNLSIIYPLAPIPAWKWISSSAVILGISLACWLHRERKPYLLVGWLWFLGMLVPVIGILQVGEQAHANRYTYLPLVGVFVMVVWPVKDWSAARSREAVGRAVAIGALGGFFLVTRAELEFWENGVTVFQRAVDVTTGSATALNNLGVELDARDRKPEAIERWRESLAIAPRPAAYINLSIALFRTGDEQQALLAINKAIQSDPHHVDVKDVMRTLERVLNNPKEEVFACRALALAFAAWGDHAEAARYVARAFKVKPTDASLLVDLAAYQSAQGKFQEALQTLRQAVELSPTNALAHSNLGALLANAGQREAAIAHYQLALAHDPRNPTTRYNLALALLRTARAAEAKMHLETILAANNRFLPAACQLAWLLASHPDLRNGTEAKKYAAIALTANGGIASAALLDITAAAHAAAGEYAEAIAAANAALNLVQPKLTTSHAAQVRRRIASYQARQPFTQTANDILAP
ncbi:MAG: tetratricopeptide repeat protein [Limisphaerales bacterium]